MKTKHLTFRCTPEQYAQIQKAANQLEISVSQFILKSLAFTSKTNTAQNKSWDILWSGLVPAPKENNTNLIKN